MNNDLSKQPISRDQIKFPYALPSKMNNIYTENSYMDRDLVNSRSTPPVQIPMHVDKINQYHFENLNQDRNVNKFMEFDPVDTRQRQYNQNKHNDEFYYHNMNGNMNRFFDNTPTSTRTGERTQQSGIDTNLLPTRLMNLPKDNI